MHNRFLGVRVKVFVILQLEHLLLECEIPVGEHYITPFISVWVTGTTTTNYLPVRPSQAPRCAKVPDAIQREGDQEIKEISQRVVGGLSRGRTGGKTPQRAHLQKHPILFLFFNLFSLFTAIQMYPLAPVCFSKDIVRLSLDQVPC